MRHYHQAAIESANGVQLIVALYDGLQRFLTQAAVACEMQRRICAPRGRAPRSQHRHPPAGQPAHGRRRSLGRAPQRFLRCRLRRHAPRFRRRIAAALSRYCAGGSQRARSMAGRRPGPLRALHDPARSADQAGAALEDHRHPPIGDRTTQQPQPGSLESDPESHDRNVILNEAKDLQSAAMQSNVSDQRKRTAKTRQRRDCLDGQSRPGSEPANAPYACTWMVSPRRRLVLLRAAASRRDSRRSAPATAAPHACPAPRSGRSPAPRSGPRAAPSRCDAR